MGLLSWLKFSFWGKIVVSLQKMITMKVAELYMHCNKG